jgi:hypothetical protein
VEACFDTACGGDEVSEGRIELSSYDPRKLDTANPGQPSPRPLAKAETFKNAPAKQGMRELAVKYEELAEWLEQAVADERN